MRPSSIQDAAELLRGFERPVRPVGGGTKPWLPDRGEEPLETGGLNRILEHNVGDFTAVLEAGVPFETAQAAFATLDRVGQVAAYRPSVTYPNNGLALALRAVAGTCGAPLGSPHGRSARKPVTNFGQRY